MYADVHVAVVETSTLAHRLDTDSNRDVVAVGRRTSPSFLRALRGLTNSRPREHGISRAALF